MVDKIADYLSNVGEDHDVLPQNVYPGYLKDILPQEAPMDGEPFEKIAEDIDKVILPGVIIENIWTDILTVSSEGFQKPKSRK